VRRSGDGSFTLYSEAYKEHYHSCREGAFSEALIKHIDPAIRHGDLLRRDRARALDICFGLGYNTLVFIWRLRQQGFTGHIEVIAPELDTALLERLRLLPYPKELSRYLEIIIAVSEGRVYEKNGVRVEVIAGDAAETVPALTGRFDAIFQDPFSPRKNPELWDRHFFDALYDHLADGGVLTTYSQAKGVRRTMREAGFGLAEHPFDPAGAFRPGTLGFKALPEGLACLPD
jgi:predicted methyltransferase